MADHRPDPDIRAALSVLARRHGDLPAAMERLLRGLDERHQPDVPGGEDPTCTWCGGEYPCPDVSDAQTLAIALVERAALRVLARRHGDLAAAQERLLAGLVEQDGGDR